MSHIYHHGIKGQRWGVIRKDKTSGQRTSRQDEDKKIDKKGLTDGQKKAIIIGASAVMAGLAIYGAYKINQGNSSKWGSVIDLGKKKLEESFDEGTGFKKINSISKNLVGIKTINPGISNPFSMGSRMNCGNCTIAYELQKRGLDVEARLNSSGMQNESIGSFFKGFREGSIVSFKPDDGLDAVKGLERGIAIHSNMANQIAKSFPDGSRGNVFIPMKNSNHFMSWVIQGGKVKFEDAQNPTIKDFRPLFSTIDTKTYAGKFFDGVRITRLDDLEVNTDNIRKVVKSRGFDMKDKVAEAFDTNIIQGVGFIMK